MGGGGGALAIALPHGVTDYKVFLVYLSFDEAKIICFVPVTIPVVNLHIVIASICKRIITDVLLLGYILSSTYICQIYLSYVCYYLSYLTAIVIISVIYSKFEV